MSTERSQKEQLTQSLDRLALQRATAEAQIAAEAAEHEYKIRLEHYQKKLAKEYAEKTYLKIANQAQTDVKNMAQNLAERAIEVELETSNQFPEFEAPSAQLTSFSETLEEKKNHYNKMALLSDKNTLTDVEENVLLSLGLADEEETIIESNGGN